MEVRLGESEDEVPVAADDGEIPDNRVFNVEQHGSDIAGGLAPVAGDNLFEVGKLRMPGALEPEIVVSERDGEEPLADDVAEGHKVAGGLSRRADVPRHDDNLRVFQFDLLRKIIESGATGARAAGRDVQVQIRRK